MPKLMVPDNVQQHAEVLCSQLKLIGINVANTSFYRLDQKSAYKNGWQYVIGGYMPQRACLFTIKVWCNHNTSYVFSVQGQALHSQYVENCIHTISLIHSFITDPDPTEHIFSFNATVVSIAQGIAFFQQFMRIMPAQRLAKVFTKVVSLRVYVPEYSNRFLSLAAKHGALSKKASWPFIRPVYDRLPYIFPIGQYTYIHQ